ncbi:alpha/beta hydrolase [Parvularcula marina]|uniref:Alpha/beta hydrolase n=1 Tax=Parvularcula marina TaxID=2292771 RepID=A0A371RJJ1_9PROT|nr:alpha/beta hydrolase [Parvularcula marina]RFB05609.1 alpha/beta hydrolase [Parvularcula marina]
MKLLKWSSIVVLALLAIYLGGATWLLMQKTEDPFADYPMEEAGWRTLQEFGGTDFSQDYAYTEREFTARDDTTLSARVYGENDGTQIVYLHGVNSRAELLNKSAGLLSGASGAQVITPDIRGHGKSGGAPYRVDYIGQYEKDLADIVSVLREENPDGRIIIAGHSMGGGIAMRFALLEEKPTIDGYLLFSPNFGEGPTQHPTPETAGTAEDPGRPFVLFDQKPFLGVLMYNMLGITLANDTPVLYFNAPGEPVAYSYGAILSAQPVAPKDSSKALAAVDVPLFVMIGERDEVFLASAYPEFVSTHSDGEAVVIPRHGHNSLMNDPAVMEKAAAWLAETADL